VCSDMRRTLAIEPTRSGAHKLSAAGKRPGFGLGETRLFYRDTRGGWYCTKIIKHQGILYSLFEGETKPDDVPENVRKAAPVISLGERHRLNMWDDVTFPPDGRLED
jgi:hypothetical protein